MDKTFALENPMKLVGTLTAINSRGDNCGNRYWALRYVCHETGKIVEGTVSGGESNIYAILQHWNDPDGWDRSVQFLRQEDLPIREFRRLVKDMSHAGCHPQDLAKFIRARLE